MASRKCWAAMGKCLRSGRVVSRRHCWPCSPLRDGDAVIHVADKRPLRVSSRRTAGPERCPSYGLGIRALSAVHAVHGANRPFDFRPVAGGATDVLGDRAGTAAIVFTGLMAREFGGGRLAQMTAALGNRALTTAAFRRDRVSIHDFRLSVVGADRVFRDSSAEDRESSMVAGDRGADRYRFHDQVHDGFLHRRESSAELC